MVTLQTFIASVQSYISARDEMRLQCFPLRHHICKRDIINSKRNRNWRAWIALRGYRLSVDHLDRIFDYVVSSAVAKCTSAHENTTRVSGVYRNNAIFLVLSNLQTNALYCFKTHKRPVKSIRRVSLWNFKKPQSECGALKPVRDSEC